MRTPELMTKLAADGAERLRPPLQWNSGYIHEEFNKWEKFFRTAELKDMARVIHTQEQTTMVKLEFFDPSGALEKAKPHAPRLASLSGKRIGFVSNEQWQAYRMLPLVKDMLETDFPRRRSAAHRPLSAGQYADRQRRSREAHQGQQRRCSDHRQRGLRGVLHSMRAVQPPESKQKESPPSPSHARILSAW
jgi:hypothetical protein